MTNAVYSAGVSLYNEKGMQMKVLINQIINAEAGLIKLANTNLPISQSIKIAKIIKELEVVYTEYNKKRKALFDKYGEASATGENNIRIADANMDAFLAELKVILGVEVEVNVDPVNLAEVGSEVKLTPAEYISVEFLLTQNEGV
jgi:hypothetical protein